MNESLANIEQRLTRIEDMLNQLLNPAQTMETRSKAKAIMDALRTGDRKHYRNVLKQINGEK